MKTKRRKPQRTKRMIKRFLTLRRRRKRLKTKRRRTHLTKRRIKRGFFNPKEREITLDAQTIIEEQLFGKNISTLVRMARELGFGEAEVPSKSTRKMPIIQAIVEN